MGDDRGAHVADVNHETGTSRADDRHIGGSTIGVIVGWVRRVAGEAAVTRMLALAGEDRPV